MTLTASSYGLKMLPKPGVRVESNFLVHLSSQFLEKENVWLKQETFSNNWKSNCAKSAYFGIL